MTLPRLVTAVLAGSLLATLPFLRYFPLVAHVEAHVDHEPRHGGQLGMVGDHHIELCRRRGNVEVFVSDAWRRPVRPDRGSVVFDNGRAERLSWHNHRQVAIDYADATDIKVEVVLADGSALMTSFAFRER
jgi:hypothetical protein